MARYLKPQVVGEHGNQQLGLRADVLLDRNTLKFFAREHIPGLAEPEDIRDDAGQRIEASSADELRKLITAAWMERPQPTWTPIVIITRDTWHGNKISTQDNHLSASIQYSASRVWIAQTGPDKWKVANWTEYSEASGRDTRLQHANNLYIKRDDRSWGHDTDAEGRLPLERLRAGVFPITQHTNSGTEYFLAYSEQLWASLRGLTQAMIWFNEQLDKLLATEEGMQRLTEGQATALLPAPAIAAPAEEPSRA